MSITFRTTTLRDLDPETLAFYERLDRPAAHGFTSDRPATGHPEHGTRSIPPVSVRRISLTPDELRDEKQLSPVTERPTLSTACTCEQDATYLAFYRRVEYGRVFDGDLQTQPTVILTVEERRPVVGIGPVHVGYGFTLVAPVTADRGALRADMTMRYDETIHTVLVMPVTPNDNDAPARHGQKVYVADYLAAVEASCPASAHMTSVAYDEALARDTTTIGENESEAVEYWENVEEFNAAYAKRTEDGGRWIETHDGSNLILDRDREDFATRIRSYEMWKKRQLRDTMLALGVSPRDAAPWVKSRIDLKRADAIREKRVAEAATLWTQSFPLPPESQIRLRAYASCLYTLRTKGPTAIRTYEPVVTSPMPRPKTTGLTPRMRAQFEKQLKHDWFTPVA